MDRINLIIFKFNTLYEILKELDEFLNFEIIEATNEKILHELKISSKNFLILTKKNIQGEDTQLYLDNLPIKFLKLLEKININFIKSQFNQKSELRIGKYIINLNSRELIEKKVKLKLTEKEVNIILYLYNSKNPVTINQLQSEVWGYNSELDTHTVETHVYRLRKKLLQNFNDKSFIQSKRNGYQVK